jgi:hypothetical protein
MQFRSFPQFLHSTLKYVTTDAFDALSNSMPTAIQVFVRIPDGIIKRHRFNLLEPEFGI